MSNRYKFLNKEEIYEALNKLRSAFLAAKDGNEVEEIIKGLLTDDERIKIGRRIIAAQLIDKNLSYDKIKKALKIGKQTILQIQKSKILYPRCFELINQREQKVEKVYKLKAYEKRGGPKQIRKVKEYTGFKRKDVKR